MAQSNNAQREPSMEEILASIRRIIEDSDTTRRTPESDAQPASPDELPEAGNNVHAFRAGLNDDAEQSQPKAPGVTREEAERLGNGFRSEAVSFSASDFGLPNDGPSAARAAGAEDEIEVELGLGDFSADRDQAEPAEPAPEPRSTIISEHAGRQVAASFGELSAAFEARSRRSFDEIAEEMMRPMLQDWLDNNLPHLVERLVREEIERIARGAPAQS